MNGNDFMTWVLRSPLHGLLSASTMLVTLKGRKSGKAITLPVNYFQEGENLWVITNRSRNWWRNLRGGVQVEVLLRRQAKLGSALPVLDEKEVEGLLAKYLVRFPQAAKVMGIGIEGAIPNKNDIMRVSSDRLFVKFTLLG
ncbi:MAG: nitroreductase family deazaflavin-dependent oxidoreductase [Anaerolineales bacterium]|nr:nitroreductase family deazaflavin-dependent oxidoreductase [Anaerolineales bacterium]